MSSYRLSSLFTPRAVAVVGASPRPGSVGGSIVRNLLAGGFAGRISIVHPRKQGIEGLSAFATLSDLPEPPDVAVLATPAHTIPQLVEEAGRKGVAAAIIVTAGLGHGSGSLAEATERAARRHGIRLVGPNCIGIIAPPTKLNASFAARMPNVGDLALVSQSGAIVAGMVEWAARRSVGFSGIVSIGDQLDVDVADLLDFFALDPATRAILLYIESVGNARKFLSAARAAARVKPVVVVKAGRHEQGARAAATHTGALAGTDAVYAAAFQRAGLSRAYDLDELFDIAETLGTVPPFAGERLAVLTNGGGLGVLAVDRLVDLGGSLSGLSPDSQSKLDAAFPGAWSRSNPIDIAGDADEGRYQIALETLLDDSANDAILVMNVPTSLASPVDIARGVAAIVKNRKARSHAAKPVFAVWIGADERASEAFKGAAIPHYDSEADAVRGFLHLVDYSKVQERLLTTPPSMPTDFSPDTETARKLVENAVVAGRTWLDTLEAAALFETYGIPVVATRGARDPDEAVRVARPLLAEHGSVAVKIWSHDVVHKSDVGGVRLGLSTAEAVRLAAEEILSRVRSLRPNARVSGVIVQPMIHRPKARELIIGVADDPTFGPVILFGHGGTATEVIDDKALALPPLDLRLARDLIASARVSRLLKTYRNVPAANEDEIARSLVKLAQLAADLPEIREIDLNPLIADETGVLALDARVSVAPVDPGSVKRGHPRFAIRPYPKEWERVLTFGKGQQVLARPVRPEDEDLFRRFFTRVSQNDLRLRFFAPVKEFGHPFVARLTQIDYARAMAFVAIDSAGELAGVVRVHSDADYLSAEYGILVRSDLKGQGLGWKMMELMIEYARHEGLQEVKGEILAENTSMLEMCAQLGFAIEQAVHDGSMRQATLRLI
jgi:acetyltransferase